MAAENKNWAYLSCKIKNNKIRKKGAEGKIFTSIAKIKLCRSIHLTTDFTKSVKQQSAHSMSNITKSTSTINLMRVITFVQQYLFKRGPKLSF